MERNQKEKKSHICEGHCKTAKYVGKEEKTSTCACGRGQREIGKKLRIFLQGQ